YQHEPFGNSLSQSSPWNFGLTYQLADSVDVNVGFERGNTAMLGITLHTPLSKLSTPKLDDPPRIKVVSGRPEKAPDWNATSQELTRQTDWKVRSIEQNGDNLRVTFDDAQANYWGDRVDRAAAVLHRDAPAGINHFTFDYRNRGIDTLEQHVDRDTWVESRTAAVPPDEQRVAMQDRPPAPAGAAADTLYQGDHDRLSTKLGMDINYSLGGPDAFLLYQIVATGEAQWRFSDNTWLQGKAQLGLIDNYDKFKFDGQSSLPRVRTYVREYVTTSDITMPNLQLTHTGKLSDNNYYSLYGGYLESMFAGVGGEWLYRPFQGRYAFGIDVNEVQQRAFNQAFGFLDSDGLPNYRVTTGHATLYWDTGWHDVQARISAGRYLAKDSGVSIDVSRVFSNGVRFGAGMTKTNVSAAQFGEGSFDKWIYFSIPFDAMLTRSGNTTGYFVWKPLMRDGGAKLNRAVTLYDLTTSRSERSIKQQAAPVPDENAIPADRHDYWTPPKGIEPYTWAEPRVPATQWRAEQNNYKQRLMEALYHQRFRDISIDFDRSYRLVIALSNDTIQPISRAVGRAARTALLNAPADAREIHITFLRGTPPAPVAEYDFIDLPRLQRYFNGELSESELANSVAISWYDSAMRQNNPLEQMGDTQTISENRSLSDVLMPDTNPYRRVQNDFSNAGHYAAGLDWLKLGAAGTGLILGSALLDKRDDRYFAQHGQDAWLKHLNNAGNTAVPLTLLGGAALAAFGSDDPTLSRTGYVSLESGATALLISSALGYSVGRARPDAGLGSAHFQAFSGADSNTSFPSDHTAFVWALATPFAEEYQAPWLYGVAAVTNFSRMGSRKHWFSDTVAGSVLGYGVGRIFWESSRNASRYPAIGTDGRSITLSWQLK
ncbi:MAG: YjbH domain-containing protein, partial [Gallionellaceae bacterium]|nr:YjbH domain-containing protein [Gallionellaceae bacterium]